MAVQRAFHLPVLPLYFCGFLGMLFLNGGGMSGSMTARTEPDKKGERMPKGRDKKEIRVRAESQARSESASARVVRGEKFELSETESKLLGDLWDRQRSSSRSNYTFTDAPSCI